MINKNSIYILCGLLFLFVVIFDQATKFSILAFIPNGTSVSICEYINLVVVYNYGTSFGLLHPSNMLQHYMMIGLTIGCVTFLSYTFFKLHNLIEKVLCSILIGGAVGNLIDRFIHGAVVDFIDIYYNHWHFPAFNFADACISCSVICFLLKSFFSKNNTY